MKNGTNQRDYKDDDAVKSSSGPTVVLLWVWNFITSLPQAILNLLTDIKNGELLSKFSFLDAMFQFLVAVATSCHPQEEAYTPEDEKQETSKEKDIKPFGGTGRTLRSRPVATNS